MPETICEEIQPTNFTKINYKNQNFSIDNINKQKSDEDFLEKNLEKGIKDSDDEVGRPSFSHNSYTFKHIPSSNAKHKTKRDTNNEVIESNEAKTSDDSKCEENSRFTRYTPLEWSIHNQQINDSTNDLIERTKDLSFGLKRLEDVIFSQIDRNNITNELFLRNRATNEFNKKFELERSNKVLRPEIERLISVYQRLGRANCTVELIKRIDDDILEKREKRLEADDVDDVLSEAINKEKSLSLEVIESYQQFMRDVKKQLEELNHVKMRLEHDFSDKTGSYEIDTECIGFNFSAPTIMRYSDSPDSIEQYLPVNYEEYAKETIKLTQAVVLKSQILRTQINDKINRNIKDLTAESKRVDLAFTIIFNQTYSALKLLKKSLIETLKAQSEAERVIVRITDDLRKLDGPAKCAETKLMIRKQREKVENCEDVPHVGLLNEVKDLRECRIIFENELNNGKNLVEKLIETRKTIENEIRVKEKTLWIDNDLCRSLRQSYPSKQSLTGYK